MRAAVEASDAVEIDELQMFRKDVGTYVRQYEFLSQLFDYENPWLEKVLGRGEQRHVPYVVHTEIRSIGLLKGDLTPTDMPAK